MRTLQILSISFRNVKTNIRAGYYCSESQLDTIVQTLSLQGLAYLQTCNRVELWIDADHDVRMEVYALWRKLCNAQELAIGTEMKTFIGNSICARYVLQLAVGLHSAIQGDDQVIAQIKKAFENSREHGRLSTLLERSYQTMMQFYKAASQLDGFNRASNALAYHAWKYAKKTWKSDKAFTEQSVLIMGAGAMAEEMIKYASNVGIKNITLTNRTRENAQNLADNFGLPILSYDDLNRYYKDFDTIVLCSDHASEHMVAQGLTPKCVIQLSPNPIKNKGASIQYAELADIQQYATPAVEHQSCKGPLLRILHGHLIQFTNWVKAWQDRQTISTYEPELMRVK